MSHESERNYLYHVERARVELDAAYRAGQAEVAAAHLRLCALHMNRARETSPRPVKELEWLEGLAPLHERALRCA
ncbi:MAG TPA: hypothetical protein VGF77_05295 [Allosphingosinicella sp.]|jgi:hypothetical protein